jgi:drug/metabolite transporter (DMT)-like permease
MQTGIAVPMVLLLPYFAQSLPVISAKYIGQIFVTAVLIMLLHLSNVKALQHLEAGVFSVLYNLRIIFTTILGVLILGEEVVALQILGGLLILSAILAIKQKGDKKLTVSGIKWGIFASVVISFLNLSEKNFISTFGYLNYAIPTMILAAIMMWLILLLQRKRIPKSLLFSGATLKLMVFRSISAYGATLAFYAGGPLSVTTYVSSLGVILIVAFGAFFLGENDYMKRKVIATSLAALGLTAILIARLG